MRSTALFLCALFGSAVSQDNDTESLGRSNATDNYAALSGTNAPTVFEGTEVPTGAPFVVPPLQDCYTDLSDLGAIVRARDPLMQETFKLCPHTVFELGVLNASSYCCVNGYPPLHPRKGTTIQCGDDGSSDNNCTFVGGSQQILSYGPHYNNEKKSNTVFKGITFESAQDIALLLMTDGEFLFDDCIFQKHANLGSIKLANYHNGNTCEGLRQRVTFNNCLFQHNSPGAKSELTHYGVVLAETDCVDVIVTDSIFMDNTFTSGIVGDSFAIRVVKDSTLEIHSSCFLSNQFVGRGAVLVDAAESIVAQSNNYGTVDPHVECQFINVGDKLCVDFDSTTCLATRYPSLVGGVSRSADA